MTKSEVYDKAKLYYNVTGNTIEKRKLAKKTIPGHILFDKSSSPLLVGVSTFVIDLALSIILTSIVKWPVYAGIPSSTGIALFSTLVVPKLIHKFITMGRSKLSRGYCKMEMDKYFVALKEFVDKNLKGFVRSDSYKKVSDEELLLFVDLFCNCTENYKSQLSKLIGKRIYKRNERDFKRIVKLINTSQHTDNLSKKIEKIISKNEKINQPWCELYNECGETAQKLYNAAKEMGGKIVIPKESSFKADYEYLGKRVGMLLGKAREPQELKNNLVLYNNKKKVTIINIPNAEKVRKYFENKEVDHEMTL